MPHVATYADKTELAYRQLDAFVGHWSMEGQQYDSPFGPPAKITALNTYEWLPGGFFLVHRLEGRLGGQEMACIEVMGYDASSDTYSTHSFYNDGSTNLWQSNERNGSRTLTGHWRKAGEDLKVRCTTVFAEDCQSMTANWEYSRDGLKWQPFMATTATKA